MLYHCEYEVNIIIILHHFTNMLLTSKYSIQSCDSRNNLMKLGSTV